MKEFGINLRIFNGLLSQLNYPNDNSGFIERLWRSVKYEKIYLNPPKDGTDLYLKITEYMEYYNNERRHEGIDDEKWKTPYFAVNLESYNICPINWGMIILRGY